MSLQFLLDNFYRNKDIIIEKIKNCKYRCANRSYYDFLTVVPKRGRQKHLHNVMQSWKNSIKNSENSHRMVVVENSDHPEALEMCKENDVDYVFIDKGKDLFNKCLSMNVGSFIHDSKYIHFHDVDIWIPSNFWINLRANIKGRNAFQSFAKRRVNYINEHTTNKIFSGEISTETAIENPSSYREGTRGAPGGSVIIKREFFNNIGGFDPHYFWEYSIEDQFFVDKIELFNKFYGCDNPPIEMFHFWHPSNEKVTPLHIKQKGLKIRSYFLHLNLNHKKNLIKLFSDFIKEQEKQVIELKDKDSNKI